MAGIAAQITRDRSAALGVGTNQNPAKFLNQDYAGLRAQCLEFGTLFEDPTFPAAQSSLGSNDLGPTSADVQGLVWKRPSEINPNPVFIHEGANRADVRQGSLGDCWFLCSVASLTLNEECLSRVVPAEQTFHDGYAGIFHFKFWQYGQWVDVVVDDRLPTKNGKLLFVKSTTANEFWSALLEKAYAKLSGSYEALKGGLPLEALEDFTGGVGELYNFENAPSNLFQIIYQSLKVKSLITATTRSDSVPEATRNSNIVKNHAYSVTGAEEISYRGDTVQIVRVRNPWGYKEWNGAWNDTASEWGEVSAEVKEQLNVKCEDGETWMPFSSFLVEFYRVEICHLSQDSMCRDEGHKWCLSLFNGRWASGVPADGQLGKAYFKKNKEVARLDLFRNFREVSKRFLLPAGNYAIIPTTFFPNEEGDFFLRVFTEKNAKAFELCNFGETNLYEAFPNSSPETELQTETEEPEEEVRDLEAQNTTLRETDHLKRAWLTEQALIGVETEGGEMGQEGQNCESCGHPTATSSTSKPLTRHKLVGQQSAYQFSYVDRTGQVQDSDNVASEDLRKAADLKSDLGVVKKSEAGLGKSGFEMVNCLGLAQGSRWLNNLGQVQIDNTKKLSAEELKNIWRKLEHYMQTFREVDTNQSGSIDAHEMRDALYRAGFSLSFQVQEVIVQRYISDGLSINFEDFISCLIRLETLFKMFELLDMSRSGAVSLSLSELDLMSQVIAEAVRININEALGGLPTKGAFDGYVSRMEGAIKRELATLQGAVAEVTHRMDDVENSHRSLETRMATLEQQQMESRRHMSDLLLAHDDVENRNRRNNLRLRGVPESVEPRDLATAVTTIFNELLELPSTNHIELDRDQTLQDSLQTNLRRASHRRSKMGAFRTVSLNVKGLNSPEKRTILLQEMRRQRAKIIFLQETHFKKSAAPRLGSRFYQIDREMAAAIEDPISVEELAGAIKQTPLGKSPGSDGYTVRYYSTFLSQLGPFVVKAWNTIADAGAPGAFSGGDLEAHITVLHKAGKDPLICQSYRPISLLNTDLKLYAKILANRLAPIVAQVVHLDQTGFVRGREARDNVVRAIDVMHWAKSRNVPAMLLSTDAEKAFDRVSWTFMKETLSHIGLGDRMRKYIDALYTRPSARVKSTQIKHTMAGIAAQIARDRSAALGVGTNQNPAKYLDQDFEELRAQCLVSGTLFEDPTFPAAQSSLGVDDLGPNSTKVQGLVWKRPSEIKPDPQFINEGADRADVRQGSLGDCWLLCSIASLTLNEKCLYRVVPADQSFQQNYAGIFHFKFWQYGQWVDVVVDDRLPTKKGKLLFVKSTTANEFWSALLEKAYAKVNGSYEALKGGLPVEALEDFTGGIGELFYFTNAPSNLFQIIQRALKAKSLVTCCTKSDSGSGEIVVSTNIVKNHAYTLTGAEEIVYRGDTVQIVRVRNPWGYKEWNGAWSDNAPEWGEVESEVKAGLNIRCDDGETWMPFSSFLVEFYRVEICHLNLDNVCSDDQHKWCVTGFNGRWTSGVTAGGCKGNPTFWTNPQFQIVLEDPNEGRDGAASNEVLVSLMQKERRRKKPQGGDLLNIGYYIYKALQDLQLGKDFFKKNKDVAHLDSYKNHREVSNRFQLPCGNYVIVPTTYSPCQEADFYLRVFTESKAEAGDFSNGVEANVYDPLSNSAPETESESGLEEPDERDEYSLEDLRSILNKKLSKYADLKCDGLSLRTCREMIHLMDTIFLDVDANRSGSIDAPEMRNAFQKAGFTLNIGIQEVVIQRYVSEGLSINFEDFISCLIRLETLFKMFDLLDTSKTGTINLSLSEWLRAALM
ncbi:uncharacterized protein PAF06_007965 [Gastrophryne carolinensis]